MTLPLLLAPAVLAAVAGTLAERAGMTIGAACAAAILLLSAPTALLAADHARGLAATVGSAAGSVVIRLAGLATVVLASGRDTEIAVTAAAVLFASLALESVAWARGRSPAEGTHG